MDTIEIKGLEMWAQHGVLEQERTVGNTFRVDISLTADLSRAMVSDCVEDTINYAGVVDIIKAEMSIPSRLLENVIWRIKNVITQTYPAVNGGKITLSKLTPPIACEVESVSVSTKW